MAKRIFQFEDVIGQTTNKAIIMNLLRSKRLPQFIFLYGDSGSGKSTLAELIAMAATCTSPKGQNPCMSCPRCIDNLHALQSDAISRNIKKVNIGKLIDKKEIKSLLHEIFDLQAIPGEKTFYILEEVHLLRNNQDMLLEELERIPEDTHVIMCTTNYNEINDTLKTRAQLKLHFQRLTPSECIILIDRLLNKYGIKNLTSADKHFLAAAANCNAREITNFLETFQAEAELGLMIRNYFSKVSVSLYLDLVNALFSDFPNFIIYLNNLESSNANILNVWQDFHSFIRDAVFYLFGGGATLFTNKEKNQVSNLFNKMSTAQIAKLYRLSNKPASSQIEAEYNLVTIQSLLHEDEGTAKSTKAEAVIENNLVAKKAAEKSTTKVKAEIKKLDLQALNNLASTNVIYKVDADFGGE